MNIPEQIPASLSELIIYFNQYKADLNTTSDTKKNQQKAFYIYEMGRGIKQISNKLFADFESAKTAWPYPFLRSAWFALFFTHPDNKDDYHVWFLKFPLDEQSKLIQVARDDFLKHFYGQIISKENVSLDDADTYATDSAYGFKPSEEKMANINAILKLQQNIVPSKFYQQVLEYIYHPLDQQLTDTEQAKQPYWLEWKNLGYQGLADLSCHMRNTFQQEVIEQQLASRIKFLPLPMLNALSSCLEHHQLSSTLANSLLAHALQSSDNAETIIACLRSISASDKQITNELLKQALKSDYKSHIELLAVICGRCWENLKEPWLMLLFLEALALSSTNKNTKTDAFDIMITDLIFIPEMREAVLEQFRSPQRSTQLTLAIGNFYSTFYPAKGGE
ncbi:MAG: DUF3549 family protein [Pseudomonadota bacterium]